MTDLSLTVQTELAGLWHRDRAAALKVADDFSFQRNVQEQLAAIEGRRFEGLDPYDGIPVAEFSAPIRLIPQAA